MEWEGAGSKTWDVCDKPKNKLEHPGNAKVRQEGEYDGLGTSIVWTSISLSDQHLQLSGSELVPRTSSLVASCLSPSQIIWPSDQAVTPPLPGPGRRPWERKTRLREMSLSIMTVFMSWMESLVLKHRNYFLRGRLSSGLGGCRRVGYAYDRELRCTQGSSWLEG